jgi:hydroxyacylglutathione hydrolase
MGVQFERTQSSLWETGGAVVVDGGSAILIDPGITPQEVDVIAQRVTAAGAKVEAILITHAHWDHLTGVGTFPSAQVCMGPAAAATLQAGPVAARMAAQAEMYGFRPRGTLRCDRVLEPGIAAQVGSLTVETLPVPGHTTDGLAFRIRAVDAMVVGDYLSTYEFPFVYHSTAAYRGTLAALIDTLENDPPGLIVPGHGDALDAPAALAIALDDLGYLHALKAAVGGALAAGLAEADATAAGAAVKPPRAGAENPERRAENARHQVEELSGCLT